MVASEYRDGLEEKDEWDPANDPEFNRKVERGIDIARFVTAVVATLTNFDTETAVQAAATAARYNAMMVTYNAATEAAIDEKDEEIDEKVEAEADTRLDDDELDPKQAQEQAQLTTRLNLMNEGYELNNSIFLQHPDSIIPASSRLVAKTVTTYPDETLFLLSLMSGPVGRLTSAGLLFYDVYENGLQITHLLGLNNVAAGRVRAINTFGSSTGKALGWLDDKLTEPAVMGRIKGKGNAFAKKLRDWVSETSGLFANKQLRPAPAMSGPRQSRTIDALNLRTPNQSPQSVKL